MVFHQPPDSPVDGGGGDDPPARIFYASIMTMSKIVLWALFLVLVILLALGITALSMWIWPAEAQQPPTHGSIILNKLTGPDQQTIYINPQQIVALRAPRRAGDFGVGVQCIINTADGKFLSVIEMCNSFVTAAEPNK